MGQWVLLQSEAELEVKAKALRRKCRGHYYTNYYFIHSTRDDDLRYTEMFYQEDGDNIYAIERRDDFYQLFYFVGDVEHVRLELPPSVEYGVLTCEIDEEEGKERQNLMLERLYANEFSDYKSFHYYDRRSGEKVKHFHLKGYEIVNQASEEKFSIMYDIFDPYSDNLPLRRAFPEFLKKMSVQSCIVNGEYAGGSMGTLDGWGNGYVFARDEFPGVGAYLLSKGIESFEQKNPNKIARATIEDHNIQSIRLHKSFGYERTKQYHKVLIRRK